MPTLSEADAFFNTHLLKERYLSYSADNRSAALAAAERDVTAALGGDAELIERLQLTRAVYEQMFYILLHPELLADPPAGATARDLLSPRAAVLLSAERTLRLNRG